MEKCWNLKRRKGNRYPRLERRNRQFLSSGILASHFIGLETSTPIRCFLFLRICPRQRVQKREQQVKNQSVQFVDEQQTPPICDARCSTYSSLQPWRLTEPLQPSARNGAMGSVGGASKAASTMALSLAWPLSSQACLLVNGCVNHTSLDGKWLLVFLHVWTMKCICICSNSYVPNS